jgi:hypothetical protein
MKQIKIIIKFKLFPEIKTIMTESSVLRRTEEFSRAKAVVIAINKVQEAIVVLAGGINGRHRLAAWLDKRIKYLCKKYLAGRRVCSFFPLRKDSTNKKIDCEGSRWIRLRRINWNWLTVGVRRNPSGIHN